LVWVAQNKFTARDRPFRIIPNPSLPGIATKIVSEGKRIALVAQWDIRFLGLAIVHRRVDRA
jgi:hypothetical protein